jgi:uncharacterized small protein (DUF1192 family)
MTFDEEPIRVVKRSLDDMSIQDLKERIEDTEGRDIAACEQMIVKKEATRKAAEAAFFKS